MGLDTGTKLREAALLHPPATVGPPAAPDMPEDVLRFYEEAAQVVQISPRAAAALLRLALETLLKSLYHGERDLNAMIGAAVKAGLPENVQQVLDYLRFSGNQAVHELRLDDTAEEAATMFDLLNFTVERLISLPRRTEELYEGLPQTMKEQIVRRDGK